MQKCEKKYINEKEEKHINNRIQPIEFPFLSKEKDRHTSISFWAKISEKRGRKKQGSIVFLFFLFLCCGCIALKLQSGSNSIPLAIENNHTYEAQSIQMYLPWTVSGEKPEVTPTTGPSTSKPSASGTSSWSILGNPTISAHFIDEVLAFYHSPATGQGQAFYDLGKAYGIDPVYALAFFGHESSFGTTGVARFTRSIGNSRPYNKNQYCSTYGCYEKYDSWYQGINEWYWQMTQYVNGTIYVAVHGYRKYLVTIDEIIPTYAPPEDHNDDAAYIYALKQEVTRARAGHVDINNWK